MNIKNFIVVFTILLGFAGYSQNESVTKSTLLKAFKKSIEQKKGSIRTLSNPWHTDNTDSTYYKQGTISLRNGKSYKGNYCYVINWTFYEKDKFVLADADYCNEPPTARVNNENDWFEIKIIEKEDYIVLELYNQNKVEDRFKVLKLIQDDSESILTLKRY